MKKFSTLCLLAFVALCGITSCKDDPESINNAPEVFVDEAGELLRTSAVLTGRIMAPANASITEYGFKVSSTSDFSSADTQTLKMEGDLASFSTQVVDLEIGSTYFFVAYATNGLDVMTSTIKAFSTPTRSGALISELELIDEISSTLTASISDDGGGTIHSVGFCWSTTPSPTIYDDHVEGEMIDDKTFTASLPQLRAGRTYYVRAYVDSETTPGASTFSYSSAKVVTVENPSIVLTELSKSHDSLSFELTSTHAEQVAYMILTESAANEHGTITGDVIFTHNNYLAANMTHQIEVAELLPETTYKIWGVAKAGEREVVSEVLSIRTDAAPQPDPTVSIEVLSASQNSVTFTVTTTDAEEAGWVLLPESMLNFYGDISISFILNGEGIIEPNKTVEVERDDLTPETTYYIYAAARAGAKEAICEPVVVTTIADPVVSVTPVSQSQRALSFKVKTENAEKAAWMLFPPEMLEFYGTITADVILLSGTKIEANSEVEVVRSELTPETEYIIYGAAQNGNKSVLSEPLKLKTTARPVVTVKEITSSPTTIELSITSANSEVVAYLVTPTASLTEEVTAETVFASNHYIAANKTVEIEVSNLSPKTDYTIYAAARSGSEYTLSEKLNVVTPEVPRDPQVSLELLTVSEQSITFAIESTDSEQVAYLLLPESYVGNYGDVTPEIILSGDYGVEANKRVEIKRDGLTPNTTYIIYAASKKGEKYAMATELKATTLIAPEVSVKVTSPSHRSVTFSITSAYAKEVAYVCLPKSDLEFWGHITSTIVFNAKKTVDANKTVEVTESNLKPDTEYVIYAAAKKDDMETLSEMTQVTTLRLPTVSFTQLSKTHNEATFKVTMADAEQAAWWVLTAAEQSTLGTLTSDLVFEKGKALVVNKEQEITWTGLEAQTEYVAYVAVKHGSESLLSGPVTFTTGELTPDILPETQKIYYTSTDENVITPYDTKAFGANIVSNTYENGQGLITFDREVISIGTKAFYNKSTLVSITIPTSVIDLGSQAFSGCSSLTAITIPGTIPTIGDYAFNNCYALKDVTIEEGVTSIGQYAFRYCDELTTFTIPDSVTSIGQYAFDGCTGLTSVNIGRGITSIGQYAFSSCSKLTKVEITDLAAWCGIGFSNDTANPLYYAKRFYLNGSLVTDLVIPDGVTSIGRCAFYCCSGLTSVTIPDSVTSIGSSAFYDCSGLTSVTIPDSVTSIGSYAFHNCNLTSITIGRGVTSIGQSAFMYCSKLTKVEITDLAAWCGIRFSDDNANPLFYAKRLYLNGSLVTDLVIPDDVTSIGSYAFCCCSGLTSVTIGNGVTSIGNSAFSSCTSLTSVTIPDSVTSIGQNAFQSCSKLTKVEITDLAAWCGIDFASSNANPLYYAKNLYLNGSLATELEIPESVSEIGDYAFYNVTGSKRIVLHMGITKLGSNSFYGCTGNLIVNCNIPDISSGSNSPFYHSQFTEISFGEEVTRIGEHAFYEHQGSPRITLPANITSIGANAFDGCEGELVVHCNVPDSSTSSGGAFYNADFTKVTIGDEVTEIGGYAFYNCTELQAVHISDLKAWCGINFVNYSSNPICNGDNLYLNGSLVTNLVIPDGVTTLDKYAFVEATCLTSVTLPESLTSIEEGDNPFRMCQAVTKFSGKFATADGYALVQDGVLRSFAQALSYQYTIPEGVTEIGNRAFYGCKNLMSVTIPAGVSTIRERAFCECDNLSTVTMAEGLATIEKYAFSYIEALNEFTIPASVTSVGEYAFYNDTALASVYCKPTTPPYTGLYDSVWHAFHINSYSNSNLKIYVPSTVADVYKIANGWKEYSGYIVGHDYSE